MTLMAVLSLFAACQKGGRQSDQAESAGDSRWDWQGAELEYRQIQAELNLARTVKPYLVLDFRKREIEIRLKGADVWNNPMETVDGDYGVLVDFSKRFQGNEQLLVRPVTENQLFASSEKTPDSRASFSNSGVKWSICRSYMPMAKIIFP